MASATGHVDARDRHQPLDPVVRQSRASKIARDDPEVLAKTIKLAQMAFDGQTLVLRRHRVKEPCPSARPAQVGVRTGRDQLAVQDRRDDGLQSRALSDDLVAAGRLPAKRLRWLVRNPDLRRRKPLA